MWYPGKIAFRAGYVDGEQWNADNVGSYSMALGRNTTASGGSSMAFGNSATANGDASTAMGYTTTAQSFASVALGRYNIVEGNSTNWYSRDPLFVCGNGSNTESRSNALTLLKNGNMTVAGSVKSESGGILAEGTFEDGTAQNLNAGTRLHWYPKKAAFRAGSVDGTEWDDGIIGNYSFASGKNTIASDEACIAIGHSTTASEPYSIAMGKLTTASGWFSTATGFRTIAQAHNSFVIGRYNFNAGTSEFWVDTDPIFEIGIGSDSDNKANALTVLKNGNVGINKYNPEVELHVRDQWTDGDAEIRITAGLVDNARLSFYQGVNRRWYIQNHTSGDYLYIYNGDYTKFACLPQSCDQWIFGSVSDIRRKENIEIKIDVLNDLLKLDAITYNYTTSETKEIGLIAQEVKKYFPEIVDGEETDSTYLSIVYSHLTPILLQGIKELKAEKDKEIEEIRRENAEVRRQYSEVKKENERIRRQSSEISSQNEELATRLAKLEKMFELLAVEKQAERRTEFAKNEM